MQFPSHPQKEFQHINPHDCPGQGRQLLGFILVSCHRNKFEDIQEPRIDFITQGVPGFLRKVVAVSIPYFIYFKSMFDNRQHLIHTYEDIISAENLLAAWREFVSGKKNKTDVQEFQAHLMDNILELHEDLSNERYRHGSYIAFKISDPKPRDIHKATVRDRLLHHAIYRKLYPFFDRSWIADSYSCRDNKGTHLAMNRFRKFAKQVSKNNTRTCWVLKCDIKKFFASINQQILIKVLVRYIPDRRIIRLLEEIIGSFYFKTPGVGLPLGNLTSQLLVNIYMNGFDQFVKHKLKAKYYVRYADDFVFLSEDKGRLENMLPLVKDFLNNTLALSLHPDKVYIKTFASGVDFLGWVHFPNHRVLRSATKRRMLRNLAEERSAARVQSYKGLLSHGNAKKLSTLHLS